VAVCSRLPDSHLTYGRPGGAAIGGVSDPSSSPRRRRAAATPAAVSVPRATTNSVRPERPDEARSVAPPIAYRLWGKVVWGKVVWGDIPSGDILSGDADRCEGRVGLRLPRRRATAGVGTGEYPGKCVAERNEGWEGASATTGRETEALSKGTGAMSIGRAAAMDRRPDGAFGLSASLFSTILFSGSTASECVGCATVGCAWACVGCVGPGGAWAGCAWASDPMKGLASTALQKRKKRGRVMGASRS